MTNITDVHLLADTKQNALKREYHSDEDDTNVPLVQAERRVKRRIQNGETVVLDD